MSPDLLEWHEPDMKNCSECNAETDTLFRSGLVPNEVCRSCYDRLAADAIAKAAGQCNPLGDISKQAVTTDKVEAGIKEVVK